MLPGPVVGLEVESNLASGGCSEQAASNGVIRW